MQFGFSINISVLVLQNTLIYIHCNKYILTRKKLEKILNSMK